MKYDLSKDHSVYYTNKDVNLNDIIYSECNTSKAYYIVSSYDNSYHKFALFDLYIVVNGVSHIQSDTMLIKSPRHTKPMSFNDFTNKYINSDFYLDIFKIFEKYL